MSDNSPIDQLKDGIRAWLLSATGLTENQIRFHDEKYPEDVEPYLTIELSPIDIPVGQNVVYHRDRGDGTLAEIVTGGRRGTIQLRAYGGRAPQVLLEKAYVSLSSERILQIQRDKGFSVLPGGGITNLTEMQDTDHLRVFMREFEVYYRVTLETDTLVTARFFNLEFTLERYEDDDEAFTETITADDSEV